MLAKRVKEWKKQYVFYSMYSSSKNMCLNLLETNNVLHNFVKTKIEDFF